MKRAVTVLLHNELGQILAVSRKDNKNDFGLPGGKVDNGETDEEAIVRETKEETGFELTDLIPLFVLEEGEYICTTFLGQYAGTKSTNEKGEVIWTSFDTIKQGSFGEYNSKLEEYYITYLEEQNK